MFGMCALFLVVCFACQRHFASIVHWEQVGWVVGCAAAGWAGLAEGHGQIDLARHGCLACMPFVERIERSASLPTTRHPSAPSAAAAT
jgi:hypothetical protein